METTYVRTNRREGGRGRRDASMPTNEENGRPKIPTGEVPEQRHKMSRDVFVTRTLSLYFYYFECTLRCGWSLMSVRSLKHDRVY